MRILYVAHVTCIRTRTLGLLYSFARLSPTCYGIGPRPTSLGLGWHGPKVHQPRAESGASYMYYVYILKSERNGKLYKGLTGDLKRRIREHNSGNSTFTRANGPWKLVYYEAFLSKEDARREELFLKSGKGKERIKHLLKL